MFEHYIYIKVLIFCSTSAIPLKTLSGEFQQCSQNKCSRINVLSFLYSDCSDENKELTVSYSVNGKTYYGVLLADSSIVKSSCYFENMKNTKSSSTANVQKSTTTNKPQPTTANRPQAAITNEPKTTTDNETKFFNQKNFLIGFNDDIYDYIFIAWIVISNISLSLGIKF